MNQRHDQQRLRFERSTTTSILRSAYIRKRTPRLDPEPLTDAREIELDADGIAFTAHVTLWRAHVIAHYADPTRTTREAANALLRWVHDHRDRLIGTSPPTAQELGLPLIGTQAVLDRIDELGADRWAIYRHGHIPQLIIRP